jgi:predicted DsbA family dithiol-disulfide isomerase
VDAVVWGDPVCPWCYVGQRRTALLRSLGVTVVHRPYQLHPSTPIGGRPLTLAPGSRIEAVYRHLAEACEREGLPFRLPATTPNTMRFLAATEVVRARWPEAHDALWAAGYAAHFAEGRDVGDPTIFRQLVDQAGADGAGRAEVEAEREVALDAEVTGVPAWRLDGRLLIPGLQDEAFFTRVVERLRATT